MDVYRKRQKEYDRCREENQRRYHDILHNRRRMDREKPVAVFSKPETKQVLQPEHLQSDMNDNAVEKTCFDCKKNLQWANRNGWANCGCYGSLKLPQQRVNPERAKVCPAFERKG